jgi:chromosome condensin MukBEF ATPase and DNA-binding subunit MukB
LNETDLKIVVVETQVILLEELNEEKEKYKDRFRSNHHIMKTNWKNLLY